SDGSRYKPSTRYGGPLGELMNFGLDTSRNLNNFVGTLYGRNDPRGGGLGDSMVGSNPADQAGARFKGGLVRGLPKNLGRNAVQQQETSLPDLQSFLAQAMELLGGGEEL